MKSQINPASFTFPINEQMMKSTISPVSFTFPINEQILVCNSNMERDNVRYESLRYVKLTKKAVIPTSDVVLNQSSPIYNWYPWD